MSSVRAPIGAVINPLPQPIDTDTAAPTPTVNPMPDPVDVQPAINPLPDSVDGFEPTLNPMPDPSLVDGGAWNPLPSVDGFAPTLNPMPDPAITVNPMPDPVDVQPTVNPLPDPAVSEYDEAAAAECADGAASADCEASTGKATKGGGRAEWFAAPETELNDISPVKPQILPDDALVITDGQADTSEAGLPAPGGLGPEIDAASQTHGPTAHQVATAAEPSSD